MFPSVEAHMYAWMHKSVCVSVEARDGSLGSSLIVLHLLFTVTGSLAESSTLCSAGQTNQLVSGTPSSPS